MKHFFTIIMCGILLFQPLQINSQEIHKHHQEIEQTHACPMHPEVEGVKGDSCHICGMFLTEKKEHNHNKIEKTHFCPMHPEVEGIKGDNCHICGMFLTEKEEHNHNEIEKTHFCPMHPEVEGIKGDNCHICGMFLTEKEKHILHNNEISKINNIKKSKYVCPMHPEVTSETPDRCPICGMNLELKKEKKEGNKIKIDKTMQENLSIKTDNVKLKKFEHRINGFANVKYNKKYLYQEYSRIEGWVREVNVFSEGDYVKKGQLLYKIYSPELLTAQEDYLLALRTKEEFRRVQGAENRLLYLGVSKKEIKKLKQTKKSTGYLPIYSNAEGIVTKLNLKNGAYINKNTNLIEIQDKDYLWVEGFIFEEDFKWIKKNQLVKIYSSNKDKIIESKINYVYPELDMKTKSNKIRIELSNSNFQPNELVNIEVLIKSNIKSLVIPIESLIQLSNKNKVIIKNKDYFEVREVKIGKRNINEVEILEGLEENENIVISGQFLINSEANLKESIIKLSGDNHAH